MKKLLCALFALLLILSLCACSPGQQSAMYIKPSKFSAETLEVLSLFDDTLQFYDLSLNKTAKSFIMSVWVYRDGKWNEDGRTSGNIAFLTGRIAVSLTETGYTLYTMDESGHVEYSSPALDTPFEECMGIGSARIDQMTPLTLNREIPIWVKIGTTSGSMSALDISNDFRAAECSAGVAVTLTVSDEIVE